MVKNCENELSSNVGRNNRIPVHREHHKFCQNELTAKEGRGQTKEIQHEKCENEPRSSDVGVGLPDEVQCAHEVPVPLLLRSGCVPRHHSHQHRAPLHPAHEPNLSRHGEVPCHRRRRLTTTGSTDSGDRPRLWLRVVLFAGSPRLPQGRSHRGSLVHL